MLCDLLPFSPARLPGVEAVYDILLKDLEEKSWTESDDLDLRVISQLIGFLVMLTIIFTNDLWMFSGVFFINQPGRQEQVGVQPHRDGPGTLSSLQCGQ